MKITHPTTGKQIGVKAFDVDPKFIMGKLVAGEWKTAKDVSWHLISDKRSIELMEETEGGEDSRSNWPLSIMENALDWRMGLAVLGYIRACQKQFGRKPKAFRLGVARNGDLYIIMPSGRILGPQ